MNKTNTQIALEIGSWLRDVRISQDLTREKLAENEGISAGAIKNLENKGKSSMDTFVAVLRGLNLLEDLASIMQRPAVSPMAMLKLGRKRQRARGKLNG